MFFPWIFGVINILSKNETTPNTIETPNNIATPPPETKAIMVVKQNPKKGPRYGIRFAKPEIIAIKSHKSTPTIESPNAYKIDKRKQIRSCPLKYAEIPLFISNNKLFKPFLYCLGIKLKNALLK